MIYILRQAEAVTPVAEVCCKMGITEQTFYRWKKKFGGMGVAELARLRQLEDENKKLKSLVADLTLTIGSDGDGLVMVMGSHVTSSSSPCA
jgi:putative transposase